MTNAYSISNIDPKEYPIISNIKNQLIQFNKELQMKKFDNIFSNLDKDLQFCERFRINSVMKNNEYCANCSFLLKTYFYLIRDMAKFWKFCEDYDYEKAWQYLQDALDEIQFSLKFSDNERKDEFIKFFEYLSVIEKLFPYRLFYSTATRDNKFVCSICDKSLLDPECDHSTGDLYWGEMASRRVVKMGMPHHILFCHNPRYKRCIFPIKYEGNHPEESPFFQVYFFIQKSGKPLKKFTYQKSEREIPRSYYNEYPLICPCPCGSETPFEDCCYNKEVIKIPYYEFKFDKSS